MSGLKALDSVPTFKGVDGTWKSPVKTADGFQNFMAKLGVGPGPGGEGVERNLLSHGHYEFNLLTRNRLQLEAAYRGSWIVGQVIDTIAEDMTRAGVQITTDKEAESVSDFQAYCTRMQIWQSLRETIQWARLYGGCIAVMQVEGQLLNKPLSIDAVDKGQFKGLTVYDRWQIWPDLTRLISVGPNMGMPEFYTIVTGTNLGNPSVEPNGTPTANQTTGQIKVHHSRCIRMDGIKLPFFQAITEMLWGESTLERMWDRLIAFDDATMNTAGLIHRALLRTVGIDGLRDILAAGGDAQEALVAQFDMMREMQSNEGITLLDKNDEFAATPYTFAGLSDVMIQLGQQVSGAAQIPLIRLFGQTPVGLSSDGSGDIRLYYDGVNAKQEAKLRVPLTDLFKVMWRSFRGKPIPKDFDFKFVPLWQMSALDKATVAKANTETLIEAHQEGAIDTATLMQELKQNSTETGLFTHISDEAIEEAEDIDPPMPGEAPEQEPGQEGKGPKIAQTKTPTPKAKTTGDSFMSRWLGKKAAMDASLGYVNPLAALGTYMGLYVAAKAAMAYKRSKNKDAWNETLGIALITKGLNGLAEKKKNKKISKDEDTADSLVAVPYAIALAAIGHRAWKRMTDAEKKEAVNDAGVAGTMKEFYAKDEPKPVTGAQKIRDWLGFKSSLKPKELKELGFTQKELEKYGFKRLTKKKAKELGI